jgi:hypothetical protein
MARKILLVCGIIAMLWYVLINIIVPIYYPGYDAASYTVSELSAIGAPTRKIWVILCIFYSVLLIAFGYGTWLSAGGNRKLTIVGIILIVDGITGLFWPPMHQRQVIASGGSTLTDTLHLLWAFIHLALILLMIGYGAAAFGRRFRIFSLSTVILFVVFGVLTTVSSRGIEADLPTPYVGIWERINIVAYMVWIVVFIIMLLRNEPTNTKNEPKFRSNTLR